MKFVGLVTLVACSSSLVACGSGSSVTDAGDAGHDAHSKPHDAATDAHDAARDAHDAARDASDARPDADAAIGVTCDAADITRGCKAGPCLVTGTAGSLPAKATVTVSALAVPTALSDDALGPTLCELKVDGTASVSGLTLTLTEPTTPPAGAVLFDYESASLSELEVTSQPSGSAVEGLVSAPGTYGATVRPGAWTLGPVGGVNVNASNDEPSLLRNLSSELIYASYFDGTHLLVCDGPRLLVYNQLPSSPKTPPDVVLGQPDLDTLLTQTSSSLFGGQNCFAVWSDGQRVAVVQGSRVLIWQTFPKANQTPADLVLGQPDFSTNAQNTGGVSAASLAQPSALASDGTQLVVADSFNSRVLVWKTFPTLIDQPADFVVGQPTFASHGFGAGAVPFAYSQGVAVDANGLFVSAYEGFGVDHVPPVGGLNPPSDFAVFPIGDGFHPNPSVLSAGSDVALLPGGGFGAIDELLGRILMMKVVPTGPATIDFLLGQPAPDFVVESPESASVVSSVANTLTGFGGGKHVAVADAHRLLMFDPPPSYNFEPAASVLGQAGFASDLVADYRGISASTLAAPADVATAGGTIAVADAANNRVLLFASSDVSNSATGAAATVVVGQADFTSFDANEGAATASAKGLSGPAGVALDGQHLVVADTENHRVLIWNTVPATSGVAADVVLGQTDFTGRRPNHSNLDADGDGFSDADASGFFYPTGVASDGTHLFVADRVNHRVLVWKTFPTVSGSAADAVLGQANFTSVQANANAGGFSVSPNGFNLPTGVTIAGTSLWVADTENNRLVRWDDAANDSPTPGAFLGQTDGASIANPNYAPASSPGAGSPNGPGAGTSTTSIFRPRAVTVSGDQLYVSETDSNRVHIFASAAPFAAIGELGQTSDTVKTANTNGVTATSLSLPQGMASDGTWLWVADANNHRVLGYPLASDPATGAAATAVLGQVSFLTNGFDQTSTAANGVTTQPRGLTVANGQLYVADTGNHRVLVFASPLTAGESPTRVYGQPNGTLALANAGGTPSSATLDAPRGVYADDTHLLIADTGNNRVLVYDPTAATNSASLVLGQTTLQTNGANVGGASASTMQEPSGVYFDGTRLWVADTGNHRVLVWNQFPTSDGQPADVVLGQASFDAVDSNAGSSGATATSMAFPSAIQAAGGDVFVADSGNNRILLYSKVPTTNGAAADGVLGQANLTSRVAATLPLDLTTLAGPVALAADAENLYVTDRDLGRVVIYAFGALKSAGDAASVLGAGGGLVLSGPGGVAVEPTAYFTSRVYVSSTGTNQVDMVEGVGRLSTP